MSEAVSAAALAFACQRVEEFALVNHQRKGDQRLESTKVWLTYLGLDEPTLGQFADWLDEFMGPGWGGDVLVAFAVGLLINQFNSGNT